MKSEDEQVAVQVSVILTLIFALAMGLMAWVFM